MGAVAHNAAAGAAVNNAVGTVGTVFRGMGSGFGGVLKDIGTEISTTLTDTPKAVGDKVLSLPTDIQNIPIAPDVTIPKLSKIIQRGDSDEMTKALESVAGIKIHEITGSPTGMSSVNIQKRIDDYMDAIKRQILSELKDCIEKWLHHIIAKEPIIGILLDLEGYIQRRISKYRLALQRKIRSEIERLAHEKLKLWQVAMFKQKILEYVRKMCPDTHSKNIHTGVVGANTDVISNVSQLSPTQIKRLQDDRTWELVDGVTPIQQLAKAHSPDTAVWADVANNTGQLLENMTAEALAAVEVDVMIQSLGYSDTTMDTFLDEDGQVRDQYINSKGETVSQIKDTELEICPPD